LNCSFDPKPSEGTRKKQAINNQERWKKKRSG